MGMQSRAGKDGRVRSPRHKVSFDLVTEDLLRFRALCRQRETV
jgi:hypothetical protein